MYFGRFKICDFPSDTLEALQRSYIYVSKPYVNRLFNGVLGSKNKLSYNCWKLNKFDFPTSTYCYEYNICEE